MTAPEPTRVAEVETEVNRLQDRYLRVVGQAETAEAERDEYKVAHAILWRVVEKVRAKCTEAHMVYYEDPGGALIDGFAEDILALLPEPVSP